MKTEILQSLVSLVVPPNNQNPVYHTVRIGELNLGSAIVSGVNIVQDYGAKQGNAVEVTLTIKF